MGGIKLTPFVLFLILLLVLVIAMIFGYNTNQIVEGYSMSDSASWTGATLYTPTIAGMSQLEIVYRKADT